MTRNIPSVWTSMAAFFWCAAVACGAVQTVAEYRLGEDDPNAAASKPGQDPTLDHAPGMLNLSRYGTPHYSSDVPGPGSTLSMQFSPQTLDAYYRLSPVTTLTDNIGIEAWVKSAAPGSGAGLGVIAYNGTPGNDGFGLFRVAGDTPFGGLGTVYEGQVGGTTVGFTAVPDQQWVDLALVRSAGMTTLYVNGQPAGQSLAQLIAPTQTFTVGAAYCPTCDRLIPTADYLDGLVDEVRLFSFSAGQFNAAADLSFHSVPEPQLAVLVIGIAATLYRRRSMVC